MAHRAVFRRDREMPPGFRIGFSKHHFIESNCGLRTHRPLLVGWTPMHETGVGKDSFSLAPWFDLDSKLTYAALPFHNNSEDLRSASKCEAESKLQLAHRARRGDLPEGQ